MARLQAAMGKEWCPIIELARIAGDKETSQELRVRCLAEVTPYLYPRRKAVDIGASGTLEDLVRQSLVEKMKAARERVAGRDTMEPIAAQRVELTTEASVPEPPTDEASPAPIQAPAPKPPPPRLTVYPPGHTTQTEGPLSSSETHSDFDPYAN